MQIEFAEIHKPEIKKKDLTSCGPQITGRDLGIFKFLLEMKFSSREAIIQKFFPTKEIDESKRTDFTARDRLYKLQANKWIETFQFPGSSKNYYKATWKAY